MACRACAARNRETIHHHGSFAVAAGGIGRPVISSGPRLLSRKKYGLRRVAGAIMRSIARMWQEKRVGIENHARILIMKRIASGGNQHLAPACGGGDSSVALNFRRRACWAAAFAR